MFKMIKQLFSAKKENVQNEMAYRTYSKYDNSIHRGAWLVDGNVWIGAYIRDGHPKYYTFITETGLCYIPRNLEFKQIQKQKFLDINTEAYIANAIDGKALPLRTLYQ